MGQFTTWRAVREHNCVRTGGWCSAFSVRMYIYSFEVCAGEPKHWRIGELKTRMYGSSRTDLIPEHMKIERGERK